MISGRENNNNIDSYNIENMKVNGQQMFTFIFQRVRAPFIIHEQVET